MKLPSVMFSVFIVFVMIGTVHQLRPFEDHGEATLLVNVMNEKDAGLVHDFSIIAYSPQLDVWYRSETFDVGQLETTDIRIPMDTRKLHGKADVWLWLRHQKRGLQDTGYTRIYQQTCTECY